MTKKAKDEQGFQAVATVKKGHIVAFGEDAEQITPPSSNGSPRLVVESIRTHPVYHFHGDWSGKDIGTIVRGLRRAYLINMRDKRREQANNQENQRSDSDE